MLGGVRHESIGVDRASQRLDNFLMGLPEKPPRSLVYRLIRTGQVRINGKRAKPMQKLQLGDDVRIPPLEAPADPKEVKASTLQRWAELIDHWTLTEGDGWVAMNKPSGLAMHGGSGLSIGLIDMLKAKHPQWQLVHRLDRATSGVVLVAKDRVNLVRLQKLWQQREVSKRYLALLEGVLSQSQTIVDVPLKKIRDGSGQHRVIADAEGQSAHTVFSVLKAYRQYSYAEALITTGRMHQIRAHAAWIGHAVVGDERYNKHPPPKGLKRLFLHAHQLTLPEPDDALITAPLPPELVACLNQLDEA